MFKKKSSKAQLRRSPPTQTNANPGKYSYRSVRTNSEKTYGRAGADSEVSAKSGKKSLATVVFGSGLALVLLISFGYVITLNSNPIVRVEGNNSLLRERTEYKAGVAELMNGSVLNKNKLTFSRTRLASELKNRFPELKQVDIAVPLIRHRLTVTAYVAKPAAIMVTQNAEYVIDEEGRALSEKGRVNLDRLESNLIVIADPSGQQIELGKPALTQRQIAWLNELIAQSDSAARPISSITLNRGGSGVTVKYDKNAYNVLFNFYAEAKQSIGAYFVVAEKIEEGTIPKPKEYVDVRIADRAYLK